MSYAETENEHHEAISTGIVHLRNGVAKLWASAANQRGQAIACSDADRARALYESSHAYADAAHRIGEISQEFEEAESFRAGAMEAIGPVPTYDALEQQALSAERAAKSSRERAEFLEKLISGLDADLGGTPRATTEDVLQDAARAARDARRFQGIRDSAVNLLDKIGGQYSAHTLVDLMTILLDGDAPETLAKFKAQVVKPEPLLVKIPEGLAEAAKRVTQPRRYDPSVGEIVTGHDVTDVDGELTTGKITYVDTDAVTVELARHRESLGWHLGYALLDRTELRPANAQESNAWTRNLQLLREENPAALKDSALLLEPGHLDDTTPYVGKLPSGGLFVGLYVGTTDAGKIKLQRPIKSGTATEDWGVRLEEVDPESVSVADAATAQEFHKLVEQAEAEIHGVQL